MVARYMMLTEETELETFVEVRVLDEVKKLAVFSPKWTERKGDVIPLGEMGLALIQLSYQTLSASCCYYPKISVESGDRPSLTGVGPFLEYCCSCSCQS